MRTHDRPHPRDDFAVARAGKAARLRAAADFNWADILADYSAS